LTSAGEEPATIQSRLEASGDGEPDVSARLADAVIADPVALLRHLDVSGRFHRDGSFGRIFHRGMVSLRENVATDSLHVSVDGNRVTAHVDGISPLALDAQTRSPYSARRAAQHNLAGMAGDLVWLARGRQGDHSCELDCEWESHDGEHASGAPASLDPDAAAWSVHVEARVGSTLDEARLRAAVGRATGCPERDLLEVVDCGDDAALDTARARLQGLAVAIADHPPLRVNLARHPAGDVVMLNVNHAAADGPGALRVLRTIAAAYAGGPEGPVDTLDFLASRELPVRPVAAPPSRAARARKRLVERLRDVLWHTAGVSPDQAAGGGVGFHLVELSTEQTARLAGEGRTSGDVLVAALSLAIGAWNLAHGTRGGRIGVLVPADLRPSEWRRDTIANLSVNARVSTTRPERGRAARALRAVAAQTARNERNRTGASLIAALQRSDLLALWAKQSVVVLQPLTANRMIDAAMLCNLGATDDVPCFGEDAGETVALWISTPARSPLSLCLGAVTLAGRMQLTFRYPRRLLGPEAARRFADGYLRQLDRLTQR
jgi:NRPS condensation-like uncharacterized protein